MTIRPSRGNRLSVPRTFIYHSVRFDLARLAGTLASPRSSKITQDQTLVEQFEKSFASLVGAPHCIAFPFARSAFYFLLQALNLPTCSEVILPPITIPPMVEAVRLLGHRPVFVDIDPDTLLFDVGSFRNALTPRTRVALLTYLFGVAGDPRPLLEICQAAGVSMVEDFSHNLGASVEGRACGTFGVAGIYSSSVTKALDTYGGGLAITSDDSLAERLRRAQNALPQPPPSRLRFKIFRTIVWNVASSPLIWTCVGFPVLRYLRRHRPAIERRMFSARQGPDSTGFPQEAFEGFTTKQAEAGLRLLERLPSDSARRERNAELIRSVLRYLGTQTPRGSPRGKNTFWQCVAVVDETQAVQSHLGREGIDVATTMLPLVCDGPSCGDSWACPAHPVASRIKNRGLYLPVHPGVKPRKLARLGRLLIAGPLGGSAQGPERDMDAR